MSPVIEKLLWFAASCSAVVAVLIVIAFAAFLCSNFISRKRDFVWFERYGDGYAEYILLDAGMCRIVHFVGKPEAPPVRIAVDDSEGRGTLMVHIVPFITPAGHRHVVASVSTLRMKGIKGIVMPFVWTDQPANWMEPGVNDMVEVLSPWTTREVIERAFKCCREDESDTD